MPSFGFCEQCTHVVHIHTYTQTHIFTERETERQRERECLAYDLDNKAHTLASFITINI